MYMYISISLRISVASDGLISLVLFLKQDRRARGGLGGALRLARAPALRRHLAHAGGERGGGGGRRLRPELRLRGAGAHGVLREDAVAAAEGGGERAQDEENEASIDLG